MGFQRFKHSAEPKGRSHPMELAKAFQVCLCCSVTPAHSPVALSMGRQAFDPDLHVWHISQGPGLCSLWSETQECQRDCLANLARAEPSLTLSFIWIKAKDKIWGYGGRGMSDVIVFCRSVNKLLARAIFQALPGVQNIQCLSPVLGIWHAFSHSIFTLWFIAEKKLGWEVKWHGDMANKDKFNRGQWTAGSELLSPLWKNSFYFFLNFFLVSEKRQKHIKRERAGCP